MGESILNRGNCKCKGPEAEKGLICVRSRDLNIQSSREGCSEQQVLARTRGKRNPLTLLMGM
jgi:hypothetical protein